MIKPFGLDKVFLELYKYFKNKEIKIDENKILKIDDEGKIKSIIENNELLKIFESKKEILKNIKKKMEKEVSWFIFKYFLFTPKYLYHISPESIENILIDISESIFILYDYFIKQQNSFDKIRVYKSFSVTKEKIKDFEVEIKKEMPNFLNEGKSELKKSIPWYLKVFFPILSPIYYTIGPFLIAAFIKKITNYIMTEIWPDVTEIFNPYFKNIITSFNKAIEDLSQISKDFEQIYSNNT